MREGLAAKERITLMDIGDDHFLPLYRQLPLRIANRFLLPLQQRELSAAVLRNVEAFQPDAVIVYKGNGITAKLLREVSARGVATVNVFPDYSPHAYGRHLRDAMGCYDLVISTKPFHPPLWDSLYGYRNECVYVPHGYDPTIHYWAAPAKSTRYDVTICAMWRPEYHRLMLAFAAALRSDNISVAVAGLGWEARAREFPAHWALLPPQTGPAYGEFLRSGRIAIAPIQTEVVVAGERQPGDEDSTRTYELAAAYCFFVHQRSRLIPTVYDEDTEVPFWSDAAELATLVRRWLPDETGRRRLAKNAHARAVPGYSVPVRADQVLAHVERIVHRRYTRQNGQPIKP